MKGKRFSGNQEEEQKVSRVRLPRDGQVLGKIDQRVGGGRMHVICSDGKTRNCKVPGRLRRALWIREGNIVIVEPWEFENDKGHILFKYNPAQVDFLRKNGHLKEIDEAL